MRISSKDGKNINCPPRDLHFSLMSFIQEPIRSHILQTPLREEHKAKLAKGYNQPKFSQAA